MKIKIVLFVALTIGVLTSFTLRTSTTGGLKVQIELPAGIKADLSDTPIDLYKTMEDVENEKSVKSIWTNASGAGDFGQVPAGTYYMDGMVESGDHVYYAVMKVDVVAGKAGSVVLKLVRNTDMEGDME